MIRWNALASDGTAVYSIDWNKRLPTGSTLNSVAYTPDPDSSNLTFTSGSVTLGVSSVTIATNKVVTEYDIKCVPTLDTGNISPVSIRLKIVKHKPAR